MPVKSAVRYIYNIYMGKASEFAQEKQTSRKGPTVPVLALVKEEKSVSPVGIKDKAGKS